MKSKRSHFYYKKPEIFNRGEKKKKCWREIIWKKRAAKQNIMILNSDYVGWLNIEDTAVDYPGVREKITNFI